MLNYLFVAAQAAGIGANYYSMKQQDRYDRQAEQLANIGFDLNAKAYEINDLGFQASNIGFEMTNSVYELEQKGAQLDQDEVRLRMQQDTLSETEQSLYDTERLGEVMATQRAILSARGTREGAGSAGAASAKTLNTFNADQRAQNLSSQFRKLQTENQLSLMKIRTFGQKVEQASNRINQFGNTLQRTNNQFGAVGNRVNQLSNSIGYKNRKSERKTKFLLDTVNMFSTNSFGGNK